MHLSLADRQAKSFPLVLAGKNCLASEDLHSSLSKQFKALPFSPVTLHFTRILRHSLGSWSHSPPVEKHLCNPELLPWAIWTPAASDHCSHAPLWTPALLIWISAHCPAILAGLCHVPVPTALTTSSRLHPAPALLTRSYPAPHAGWYPSLALVSREVLCK